MSLVKVTSVYRTKNGQVVQVKVPHFNEETDVDNPLPWLSSGEKPKLTIPKSKMDTLEGLKDGAALIGKNLGGIMPIEYILAFMGNALRLLFTEKLEVPWELTSKVIIQPGDITPMDLVNLNIEGDSKESEMDNTGTGDMDELNKKTPIEVLANLIAGYRILSLNRSGTLQYQSNLKTRISDTLKQSGIIQNSIDSGVYNQTTWITNSDYRKMCALIDLYFAKFTNTAYSPIRICVQGSRYKDCAIINDYAYAEKISGLTTWGFLSLGINSAISNEIEKELDYINVECNPNGYYPYIKEFGIISKSPYSATVNPNTHNWINVTAALLGETRGANSRLAPGGSNSQVLMNGIASSWMLRKKNAIDPKIGESAEKLEEYRRAASTVESVEVDAIAIIEIIQILEEQTTEADEIMNWAKTRAAMIQEPREGSVGAYLKSILA
ncbi:nucleoprotein [Almendravirus chico]|uniref:nucleoprotein n=1 Tax=Almendravirus chico TaxID=1972687 RepID=UPI001E281B1F|nr:nucleoprotein [Almendravirus chico]